MSSDDRTKVPDAADPAAGNHATQLIGQFVVNFSRYISILESGLGMCVGIRSAQANRVMWAITSEMEEFGLRRAFFRATALVREPTPTERKIRTALNKRGQALTTRRNEFAHGQWSTVSSTGVEVNGTLTQDVSYEPSLWRVGGNLNDEPHHTVVINSRDALAVLVEEAGAVAGLFGGYIEGLLIAIPGTPGVEDRLGFVDDKLVRRDLSGWRAGEPS